MPKVFVYQKESVGMRAQHVCSITKNKTYWNCLGWCQSMRSPTSWVSCKTQWASKTTRALDWLMRGTVGSFWTGVVVEFSIGKNDSSAHDLGYKIEASLMFATSPSNLQLEELLPCTIPLLTLFLFRRNAHSITLLLVTSSISSFELHKINQFLFPVIIRVLKHELACFISWQLNLLTLIVSDWSLKLLDSDRDERRSWSTVLRKIHWTRVFCKNTFPKTVCWRLQV